VSNGRSQRIEVLPVADESVDCVISNGVINLCPDKSAVFAEAGRVLRPGGRLAIADIVTEKELTEAIVSDADLWASCIGGAAEQDAYGRTIVAAGLRVERVRANHYDFISPQRTRRQHHLRSQEHLAARPQTRVTRPRGRRLTRRV
jgi:arsenite methyltransferase